MMSTTSTRRSFGAFPALVAVVAGVLPACGGTVRTAAGDAGSESSAACTVPPGTYTVHVLAKPSNPACPNLVQTITVNADGSVAEEDAAVIGAPKTTFDPSTCIFTMTSGSIDSSFSESFQIGDMVEPGGEVGTGTATTTLTVDGGVANEVCSYGFGLTMD